MARIPRLLNEGEATVYHVMSRSALEGFPLGDVEKEVLLGLIQKFAKLYFVDVLGFSLMGNHFHLLVRVHPDSDYTDKEIKARVEAYYEGEKEVFSFTIPTYRDKLGSLSEFVRDIKQGFTRYFNKERKRWGFFWGQRFKSVIVEDGDTLINCLAYIDLNPVRAGIVERPEEYRWNSLGYLLQTGNKDGFLCQEYGIRGEERLTMQQRIEKYRRFVYEVGSLESTKGKSISKDVLQREEKKGYQITRSDRFQHRTRYFTDSGVIGSRKFVASCSRRFSDYFDCKREKVPIAIKGLDGCYSLKQLASTGTY